MSSTSEVEAHVTRKYEIKKRLGKGVSYELLHFDFVFNRLKM